VPIPCASAAVLYIIKKVIEIFDDDNMLSSNISIITTRTILTIIVNIVFDNSPYIKIVVKYVMIYKCNNTFMMRMSHYSEV